MFRKFIVVLATGFGLGYSPIASGTVGSFWGLVIVWLCWGHFPIMGQLVFATLLAAVSIPICSVGESHFQKKDDGRIVADEYMTFPICMIGLPLVPWVLVVAFLTNRFFDILKPPPANELQRLKSGLGIVADDVMSALYSLAANHAVFWAVSRYIG